MVTIERYEGFRIVRDSVEQSGAGFYARIGPLAFDPQVHRELEGPLANKPGTVWVLVLHPDDDRVVACASVHTDRLATKGEVWFDNAWVHPEHRQHGLHARMFGLRMQIAQELGATTIRGLARPTARLAFEAHGFSIISTRGQWRVYERDLTDGKPL